MASWADAFSSSGSSAAAAAPVSTPSSGGWADAFGGGGSSASGSADGPIAIAQQSLDKTESDITGFESTPAWAKAFAGQIANPKPHVNPILKALSALDYPRASVLGLARQAEHAATGLGWSNAQLHQDLEHHTGAGQLVQSSGLAKSGLLGKPGLQQRISSDIFGFFGDVASDPLSYVGGLGEAGAGGDAAAGKVAEAVAAHGTADAAAAEADRIGQLAAKAGEGEGAAALGTQHAAAMQTALDAASKADALDPTGALSTETALRLQKGGLAALEPEEKAALGVRTGLGMHVPGTRLASSLGLMDEPAMIRLLPEGVTDGLMGGLHAGTDAVKGTAFASALAEKFTQFPELRQAIRDAASEGDGQKVADLTNTLRAQPVAGGAARAFMQEWGAKAAKAWEDIPDWAHEDAVSAIEGDAGKAADLSAAGVDVKPVKDFYQGIKAAASEKGVDLGDKIDQYFPHQLTDAAKEGMGNTVHGAGRKTFEGQLKRTYSAGDMFLGQPLRTGSIDEINSIARETFGEDAYSLFSKEGPQVTNRYVKGLSTAVGQKAYADELERLGVVRNAVTDSAGRAALRAPAVEAPAALKDFAEHGTEAVPASVGTTKAADSTFDATAGIDPHADPVTSAKSLTQQAEEADNQAQLSGHTAPDTEVRQALQKPSYQAAAGDMVERAWVDLGDKGAFAGKEMPDYVKATLDKMDELRKAQKPTTNSMLKYYDKWIGLWKNYQLAMPGKALRHQIGGIWNAWLGDVALDNAAHGMGAWRAFEKGGIDAVDAGDKEWVQQFVDAGLKHADIFHEDDLIGKGATTWNPLSRNFKYFAANRNAQSLAQDYIRVSMFYDSIENGAHPLEAASKVRTMLGDPGMLTQFEKSTVRRVLPFYTFMRTNMPVQLENMVTQPGKFMAFYHAKQNIEAGVPLDKLMPQFYADTMAIRTGFKSGGNSVYLSPDLPFTRLGEYLSGPRQLLAQTTPLLKLPIEMMMNEPAYTGQPFNPSAKKAPGTWTQIPGLMQALSHLGLASKVSGTQNANLGPQGSWSMTPKAEYLVESLLPPLGQARRALPEGEDGMQARQGTTLASDLLGQNFRTLDPVQQSGELYARNAAMKALVEKLQNEGRLPSYIPGFHR